MDIKLRFAAFLIPLSLILYSCGSDDNKSETAIFSLGVSDAPVDNVEILNICFSAVEFKALGDGESKTFTVGDDAEILPANSVCPDATNTVGINILDYIGEAAELLIEDAEIMAGEYKVRIIMSEGSHAFPPGVDLTEENKIPVTVPSNELKLVNAITFAQGGVAGFTLEFDVRKSMVDAVGQEGYKLKPTGIRLVNNTEVGTLSGTVTDQYLIDSSCEDVPNGEGDGVASIYIFTNPSTEPLNPDEVYATGTVMTDGASNNSYEIGYIYTAENADTYDVAISCSEFIIVDGEPQGGEPVFIETVEGVVIEAGETTDVSFPTPL